MKEGGKELESEIETVSKREMERSTNMKDTSRVNCHFRFYEISSISFIKNEIFSVTETDARSHILDFFWGETVTY